MRPPRGKVAASSTIKARVEPSTKARWQAAATDAGLSLSEWLTELAQEAAAEAERRTAGDEDAEARFRADHGPDSLLTTRY